MELQHEDEYINNAIIPPPQELADIEPKHKYTRLVIDSKDRDISLFPDPNKYEIKLEDDIDDVVSAHLLSIDVHLSSYMINKYFKEFDLIISGVISKVILDEGDYTATSLASMIQTKMNMISNNTFEVVYDEIKDNYIFRSHISFSISFVNQTNSLHQLLGFKKDTYASIDTEISPHPHVLKSLYRKNFKYNNYVIMNIEQFDINKSNSNIIQKSFAIIMDNYSNINLGDDPKIIKTFTPPIPRLAKLRISFVDRYGNTYDFQNMDHRIEILFTSYNIMFLHNKNDCSSS
jgi:hypothetical protein